MLFSRQIPEKKLWETSTTTVFKYSCIELASTLTNKFTCENLNKCFKSIENLQFWGSVSVQSAPVLIYTNQQSQNNNSRTIYKKNLQSPLTHARTHALNDEFEQFFSEFS